MLCKPRTRHVVCQCQRNLVSIHLPGPLRRRCTQVDTLTKQLERSLERQQSAEAARAQQDAAAREQVRP